MGGSNFILCICFSGYGPMGPRKNRECIWKRWKTGSTCPVRKIPYAALQRATLHESVQSATLSWFACTLWMFQFRFWIWNDSGNLLKQNKVKAKVLDLVVCMRCERGARCAICLSFAQCTNKQYICSLWCAPFRISSRWERYFPRYGNRGPNRVQWSWAWTLLQFAMELGFRFLGSPLNGACSTLQDYSSRPVYGNSWLQRKTSMSRTYLIRR